MMPVAYNYGPAAYSYSQPAPAPLPYYVPPAYAPYGAPPAAVPYGYSYASPPLPPPSMYPVPQQSFSGYAQVCAAGAGVLSLIM